LTIKPGYVASDQRIRVSSKETLRGLGRRGIAPMTQNKRCISVPPHMNLSDMQRTVGKNALELVANHVSDQTESSGEGMRFISTRCMDIAGQIGKLYQE
jgi:hypothetical protein